MANPIPTSTQTFGIELEFLCLRPLTLPAAIASNSPDSDIYDAIYDALVRHGIPVSDHNSLDISNDAPPYSQWRVEHESLELTAAEQALLPEGYIAESVELASRKFFYAHENWRAEIFAVLQALQELEVSGGVKFITNASTGFHVHVGYHEHIVPLRTAKNVFLFATAFESLFDELHAAPRIAIPWSKTERHHCYPLSYFAIKQGFGNSLFERLQCIERMTTYEAIGTAFILPEERPGDEGCTGHNSAINFDNLFPDEEGGRYAETLTGTIEFRQHAGTLEFDAIVAWIEVTVGIVRNAEDVQDHAQSMGSFVDTLAGAPAKRNGWAGRNSILGEGDLGVPEDTYAYINALTNGTLAVPIPSVTPAHSPLIFLLSENYQAKVNSTSREAVHATIRDKFAQGVFGHDPTFVPFVVEESIGEELMEFKTMEKEGRGCLGWDEEELSVAMQAIFTLLAKEHEKAIEKAFAPI